MVVVDFDSFDHDDVSLANIMWRKFKASVATKSSLEDSSKEAWVTKMSDAEAVYHQVYDSHHGMFTLKVNLERVILLLLKSILITPVWRKLQILLLMICSRNLEDHQNLCAIPRIMCQSERRMFINRHLHQIGHQQLSLELRIVPWKTLACFTRS